MEAEELAVEWLRWVGFRDARRLADATPEGIAGTDVRAVAAFDPLPLEPSDLAALSRWATRHGAAAISFAFAGWTTDAYELAERLDVALVRFTFAGNVEASNAASCNLVAARGGA